MADPKPRKRQATDRSKTVQGILVTVIGAAILAAGAYILKLGLILFGPAYAQKVTWVSGDSPGMKVWAEDESINKIMPWVYPQFVPWRDLEPELERNLLPKLFKYPSGFRFQPQDLHGKRNQVMKIVEPSSKGFCYVWISMNFDKGGEDYHVNVGGDKKRPYTWQSYQRFSDGTYRRLSSIYATLEDACPPTERPCIYE